MHLGCQKVQEKESEIQGRMWNKRSKGPVYTIQRSGRGAHRSGQEKAIEIRDVSRFLDKTTVHRSARQSTRYTKVVSNDT